eukprot:3941357-Rhodomonas_salina.6
MNPSPRHHLSPSPRHGVPIQSAAQPPPVPREPESAPAQLDSEGHVDADSEGHVTPIAESLRSPAQGPANSPASLLFSGSHEASPSQAASASPLSTTQPQPAA